MLGVGGFSQGQLSERAAVPAPIGEHGDVRPGADIRRNFRLALKQEHGVAQAGRIQRGFQAKWAAADDGCARRVFSLFDAAAEGGFSRRDAGRFWVH